MKRIVLLLLTLALLGVCLSAPAEESDTVTICVLLTSDLHGAIVDSVYSSGDAETVDGTGLARLATLIGQYRETYPNTILIDNGDTTQGTPLTYYYVSYAPEAKDPAIRALRLLDYDVWSLGNHDFNYGMDVLLKQIGEATAAP